MAGKISVLSNLRVAGALVLDDMSDFPASPSVGTMVIKQQALFAYINIGGVTNWYPLVRIPQSYSHTQSAPALVWTIEHNLASSNIWYQIQDDNGQLTTPGDIEFVDNNTIKLTFFEPVQGKVLVLASGLDGEQGIEGDDGKSAYELAVEAGFVGTQAQWLASLKGVDGKSAYQVAVDGGFVGTVEQWLDSLKGAPGTGINADLQGVRHTKVDKGTVNSGTVTFDMVGANFQRLQVGGALTIALAGFPANKYGEIGIKLVNGGSAVVTWPAINWVKSDGTFTTNFAQSGVTLQAAGTDFVYLWSDDGGTTVYGKVMR